MLSPQSVGVRAKSDSAATRTNVLYEESMKADEDVRNEIGPEMVTATRRIEAARRKNKDTKTAVASIDGYNEESNFKFSRARF